MSNANAHKWISKPHFLSPQRACYIDNGQANPIHISSPNIEVRLILNGDIYQGATISIPECFKTCFKKSQAIQNMF